MRPAAAALHLVALLAALLSPVVGDQPDRALQQTPVSCNNTESGRWYIADDRGMVCERDNLNYQTGCCNTGDLHSCETCEAEDKCCSQYERCVSCCLKPDNQPEQHMRSIYRGRNKPETGHWATVFEYCQAVCRTTARSTQHENAFILDRKHCFSKLGRPHVPVPPAPPVPKTITIVAGASGQSCDATCSAKTMACAPDHFVSLNDCNSLRAKFMCEAGCGPAAPDQREFPGYVEGSAPKHQRPAFCTTLPPFPGQAGPSFNCSSAAGSVRRLCPCEALPAAAAATAAAAAAQDDGTAGAAQDATAAAAGAGDTAAQQQAAVAEQQQAERAAAAAQQAGQAAAQQGQEAAAQLQGAQPGGTAGTQ